MREVAAVVADRPVGARREVGVATGSSLCSVPSTVIRNAPAVTKTTPSASGSCSGRSLPPPGETSIMYWEKVSAKPDSGRASTQSRVPCQMRQVAGDDVGVGAARDHRVGLPEHRPVAEQLGLRGSSAGGSGSSSCFSSADQAVRAARRSSTGRRAARCAGPRRQGAVGVRRDGVAVVEPARVDDEGGVGRERRRSRRRPGAIRPFWLRPAISAGRGAIQRTTSLRRVPALPGLGPDGGQADCSDEMPPQAVPKSPWSSLQLGDAGRVVGDDAVDVAATQRRPQVLAVVGLADRRAALELGGPVGDRLRLEDEVVRARLDGDVDAVAPGRAHHRAPRRSWTGAAGARRRRCAGRPRSGRRWRVLGAARPGGEEVRVVPPVRRRARARSRRRSSACTIIMAPKPAELGQIAFQLRGVDSGGNSSTPDGARKHLKPKTPVVVQAAQVVDVARDGAAPEPDVDVAAPVAPPSA